MAAGTVYNGSRSSVGTFQCMLQRFAEQHGALLVEPIRHEEV